MVENLNLVAGDNITLEQDGSDLIITGEAGSASGTWVGTDEPQDENINLWINPDEVTNTQQQEELYSTSEIVVGKWIDGKNLYRKVFEFNTPSSSTSYTNVATITNADEVIDIKGYINVGYPRISVNVYADSTNYSTFYYDTSSKYIYAKVGSSYTSKPCKLIVEYTKTTD